MKKAYNELGRGVLTVGQSGEVLAQEQTTAKSKEGVIAALGSAASQLWSTLGEFISSVKQLDVPLRSGRADVEASESRVRQAAIVRVHEMGRSGRRTE